MTVAGSFDGLPASSLADRDVLARLRASSPGYDKLLRLEVRELGPVLRLSTSLSPIEGGTEVVLGSRLLDVRSGRAEAELQSHWQHGGAFVVKGTWSLEQDMTAALAAIFSPAPPGVGD